MSQYVGMIKNYKYLVSYYHPNNSESKSKVRKI